MLRVTGQRRWVCPRYSTRDFLDVRDERMKRFASIIHRHVKMAVVASAGWEDIRRIKNEFFPKNRFPKGKFQPYNVLFHGLMSSLIHQLYERGVREKIDFVFDMQGALGKMAVETFDRIWGELTPKLAALVGGRPIHRDDKEILPLQAAHTIAWLYRRYAQENNLSHDLCGWKPTQPYLKKLGQIPTMCTWFPYERLAPLFSVAVKTLAAKA
jgi:hypothetical protein